MAILERLIREYVDFDPKNVEHRKAYLMLQYQGRQHPTLRFVLKVPHNSVLHMMQAEMSKYLCEAEISDMGIDTTYQQPAEENEAVEAAIRNFMDAAPAVLRFRTQRSAEPQVSLNNLATA